MTKPVKAEEQSASDHPGGDLNATRNPFSKVAALTIGRSDKPFSGRTYHNLSVTLNFKRGNGLSDRSFTKAGEEVFVTFDMSLAQANLVVTFIEENKKDSRRTVEIKDVAFQKPLATLHAIKEKQTTRSDSKATAKLQGGLAGKIKLSGGTVKADAALKGGLHKSNATETKSVSSTEYSLANITATNTANRIDWNIMPSQRLNDALTHVASHLEGETFLNEKTLRAVPACRFKVNPFIQAGELVVTAAVMVRMEDIHLHAISFCDRFGSEVRVGDVTDPYGRPANHLGNVFLPRNEKKIRLLKQIIRKN